MEQPKNLGHARETDTPALLPVSVIIAARNEARNLPRCLEALRGFAEVFVIDSQSTDATVEVTRNHGAQVVQFYYHGAEEAAVGDGYSASGQRLDLIARRRRDDDTRTRKRNSALDPESDLTGYYVSLQQYFLCRHLKHSGKLVETRAVPQGTGPF